MSSAGVGTRCVTTGAFVQNCWLVWDETTRDAAIVDPGEGHVEILDAVRELGLTPRAIWLTHAHIDHILGLDAVREATGAEVWLHPDDRRWYDGLPEQGRLFGVPGLRRPGPPDHEFIPGQRLHLGDLTFEVRHVPGHAPGHVALLGHGLAISGDVLFAGSIGRTDLADGDLPTLLESIRRELWPLADETRVLSGHGPETTIGHERRSNPFVGEG